MLRLQQENGISLNPAHIKFISTLRNDVYISTINEGANVIVHLKTRDDAILFAEYVELLVDISNIGQTNNTQKVVIEGFEYYFAGYLRPRVQNEVLTLIQKKLSERQIAE